MQVSEVCVAGLSKPVVVDARVRRLALDRWIRRCVLLSTWTLIGLLACTAVHADAIANPAEMIQEQLGPMLDSLTQASASAANGDVASAATQIEVTVSLADGLLSTLRSPGMVATLGKTGTAFQKGVLRFQGRLLKAKMLVETPGVAGPAALKAMLGAVSDGQRLRRLLPAVPASATVIALGEVPSRTMALHYSGDVVCFHVEILNGNNNPACGSAEVSVTNLTGAASDLLVVGSPSMSSATDFCLTMGPDAGTLRVTVSVCDQSTSTLLYNYGVPKKKGRPLSAPRSLVVATNTLQSVQLMWSYDGAGSDGFCVERSGSDGGPWTRVALTGSALAASTSAASKTSAAYSYVDSGLAESTTYYYRVQAYNATGRSGYSNTASARTPSKQDKKAPSVPSGLTASVVSTTEIDLSWDAATDTGGSGLHGYLVYRDGVLIATTPTTSYACVDLTSGTQYCFTVAADDTDGNVSAQCTPVCATTLSPVTPPAGDTTPPTIPNGVIASADSTTQVTIRWNGSSDDGGSGVAGYRIYRSGSLVATTAATTYSNGGLAPNTQYCYTIVAYDSAGNSSSSSAQSCAATPPLPDTTAPSKPAGVAATASSATQITVSWNASTDTGGSGLAGYRVYRGGTLVGTAASTSYSDGGLNPSTQYCYTVVAYDGAGNSSAASSQACATTQALPDTTAPSTPGGVAATASSATQITVSWNASTDTGGSGVAGYWVYRNGVLVATTAAISYVDAGVAPSAECCYSIVAFDGAGNSSSASAQVCATTPASAGDGPAAPSNLAVVAATATEITLSWQDNSDNELGFEVEQSMSEGGPWALIGTTGPDVTSFTDVGLAPSTTYYYRVSAFN